jgi:hypothetical protein
MVKSILLIFITLIFISACGKDDKSKTKPTIASPGILVSAIYNSSTLQTEFTGANLNWLGNTGTDYVVGVSAGAVAVIDGAPINMVLTGYAPGTTTSTASGNASLSRIFICPAGTTHYSRIVCSGSVLSP